MNVRYLLFAAALTAVSSPAYAQTEPTPVVRIDYIMTFADGTPFEHWSIDADGKASLLLQPKHATRPLAQYNLSAEDFERMRVLLAPGEEMAARNFPCAASLDPPADTLLIWTRPDETQDVSAFRAGCVRPGEADEFFALTRAGDALFHEMTGTSAE